MKRFDTMIAAFLLNSSKREPSLEYIAEKYGSITLPSKESVVGPKGKSQKSLLELSEQEISQYAGTKAEAIFSLQETLSKELEQDGLLELFESIEMPLAGVLKDVEQAGIKIDIPFLKKLSEKLTKESEELEKEIYKIAGEEFNISSPKQLQVILFEKLKLVTKKKTKTGYSTDVTVLEELSKDHPLPEKILEYRQMQKLLSTYIDALPAIADPNTDRVHTTFNQTIAQTGRLSSTNPNLQNIPIRTETGRELRKAFIAEKGSHILAADYSQIELRVFAHFSGDKNLIDAFQNNIDIHAKTASLIFDKDPENVTSDERRISKTINFGVIYGMGPFRLARELKISRTEAQEFINRYFEEYQGVRIYLDELVESAKRDGYLCTITGRRRYFPELKSQNRVLVEAGKREATNFPLQGSAADIIKIAMINIDRELKKQKAETKMVLQVHDELLFEVPDHEAEDITKMVVKEMESVIKLEVPLKVDVGIGKSWYEAH